MTASREDADEFVSPSPLMVGGEMPTWSDQASLTGPFRSPLGIDLVRSLVDTAERVLLVGPHSYDLVDDLAERCTELHVIVRSLPDAETLCQRTPLTNLTVWCGSIGGFKPSSRFDLIVALDGLGRIEGVDQPATAGGRLLRKLSELLAPSGQAVVALHNILGLQQIVSASPASGGNEGRDWTPSPVSDWPTTPTDVEQWCEEAGFRVLRTLSAFPNVYAPTLVAATDVLRRHRHDEGLSTMVSQAFNHEIEVRLPLKDPRTLARTALKAGLASELAAGWVVHLAQRWGAESDSLPALPPVLFAEADEGTYWGLKYALTPMPGGAWSRSLLPSVDLSTRKSGRVERLAGRLEGLVPSGILFEERVAEACAMHDIPAIRQLLLSYVSWLSDRAEQSGTNPSAFGTGAYVTRGSLEGAHVFSVFDNVVMSADSMEVLDPSWDLKCEVPVEAVVLRSFRRFAQRLVVGGHSHPWPCGTSPAYISRSMAAMVGIKVDEGLRKLVASLDAELADDLPTWTSNADVHERARALESTLDRPLGHATVVGYDEARAAVEQLTAQLAEVEDQVGWLIQRVHQKQAQLVKARARYRALKRSREYQLGASLLQKREALRVWRRRGPQPEEPSEAHLWRPPKPSSPQSRLDPSLLPPGRRPPLREADN